MQSVISPWNPGSQYTWLLNPRQSATGTAAAMAADIDKTFEQAHRTIASWPDYQVTPLESLGEIAASLQLAGVHYKDESERFGLGSFKALGGAYAVARLLLRQLAVHISAGESISDEPAVSEPEVAELTVEDLLSGRYQHICAETTVCCATDGNHGRSVAWGAQLFGCRCVIFIHATVSEGRRQAIERFGAEVSRTTGNYDDSVREAQETASAEGWHVVSDTSWPGYTDVPEHVMQGYELMAHEALEAMSAAPTHVLLQTGVGGMAAAVARRCLRWAEHRGVAPPRIVLADPDLAACWLESVAAGTPVVIEGDLDTVMAGLACGEVSAIAWKFLQHAATAVVAVPDSDVAPVMRQLAAGQGKRRSIVAGESAVAGLAALQALAVDPAARSALALDAQSQVLVFGTEGDTDPDVYETMVGESGDAVRARRHSQGVS